MALTRRQWDVLEFVAGFIRKQGYSPSYEEICMGVRVSSLATVHKHVSTLHEKGFLVRGAHQSRSIELGPRYIAEARKRAREQRAPAPWGGALPLLGRIAAGQPLEAVENPESISLADFSGNKDVFVLQVKGDSMIEEHILDGDYILVERVSVARNGDIVVALVNGSEATLKRFYQEGDGRVRLQPANPAMSALVLPAEAVQVQGRLIGVLRRY
jgi:repressor LexA